MLPSLPALRAFDAAARLGSFRAAAEQLSVSATAVSHHIRGLEQQLGRRLFDRTGRTVALTEDGKKLSEATRQAFGLLEGAVDALREAPRKVVRIAAGPIFTARWLMPRIGEFWERHPDLELEFLPSYRPGDLATGSADIVIRWERVQDMPANATKLLELEPVVVASPAFVERYGPFGDPGDLLSVPILHQRNHWGWLDWFSAQGVKSSDALRGALFEDANVMLRGAAEGQGAIVGWLPLIEQDLRDGRIVRLFDEKIAPTHGYFAELRAGARPRKDIQSVFNWLVSLNHAPPQ
ncbi:MAG: LysR substrate-binding domain-containing protein [Ruegeria sp.]